MRLCWRSQAMFRGAFLVLVLSSSATSNLPKFIEIGALFNDADGVPHQRAFQHALKMINDDRSILTRSLLNENVRNYPADDSFKGSRQLCELLRGRSGAGPVAIFGPSTPTVANHVESVSNTLQVPFIESRWEYSNERAPFSLNVHPHPAKIGIAYRDYIISAGWKSVVVLYESEEGLVRLQEVVKLPKTFSGVTVTMRQLTPGTTDYRPLFKEINKSHEKRIILDCDFDKIEPILRQADEVGMLTDYHSYLFTSLDMDKVDISPYKESNVNITGFRMMDMESDMVQRYLKEYPSTGRGKEHILYSDNALAYDTVWLLAKALDDLGSREPLTLSPMSCEMPPQPWADGEKMLGYLREAQHSGLTGEIKFDDDGYRTEFRMELIEKHRSRLKKTGLWSETTGVNYTLTATEIEGAMIEKLENKTLRIVTATTEPYVLERLFDYPVTKESKERMSFKEKYEGFCVDLIEELAKEVKFKYKFHLNNAYGSYDEATGQWNGMIAELRSQTADMAAIDMSITGIRQGAVDFTMPFMNTGVGILFKKKNPPAPDLFSFLEPLSLDVWIYMTTAYLGVSILMFLLARLTPYEWENPHPCVDEPGELENELTLHNCFWHNWGSLMQQGSDIAPKAISTRMVAGMWWFFTLIMISSYTANLAAFLTAAKMESAINGADDLASQTKIKYGTYSGGSTNSFFKKSNIPTYAKINAAMESAKPSVYTNGNKEGVERVLKEDGVYAYFMEGAAIEYHIERYCDLKMLGGLLDSKGYGIALPKDSPYTAAMSAGVLKLQEKGILQKLKIEWWKNQRGGGQCKPKSSTANAQLDLANLGGVFIVLIGGMGISIIIAIFEFAWKQRKLAVDDEESLLRDMWEEFKFAVNFRAGDTKPIKKESSRAPSKSLLSKSNAESLNKYGMISDEVKSLKSNRSRKDSTYAVFEDTDGERE